MRNTLLTACGAALGMENGNIQPHQLTASSSQSVAFTKPTEGRINNPNGFWSPDNSAVGEWLRIDLAKMVAVTKVATQGRSPVHSGTHRWVKTYKLASSEDAAAWEVYKDEGQEKVSLRFI